MSKRVKCSRGKGCGLLACLCAFHLVIALVYILHVNDRLSFSTDFYFTNNMSVRTYQELEATMVVGEEETVTQEEAESTEVAVSTDEQETRQFVEHLNMCPRVSPNLLGPMKIIFRYRPPSLEMIRKSNPELEEGGSWRPKNCTARQKVAIIIPFRNRETHLRHWLFYLHPVLQRQQLDYKVYIINQVGDTTFNRGKLMNVGYVESLKEYDYDCFVFSDVDIIPMNDRNLYRCYSQPRHLVASLDLFGYKLPYPEMFGGVTALSKEQYTKINGFPNTYWGWGGEDDDVSKRLFLKNMIISRPDMYTGRCRMIRHHTDEHNEPNPERFEKLNQTMYMVDQDGLNSLHYRVVSFDETTFYTNITVDVGKPPSIHTKGKYDT